MIDNTMIKIKNKETVKIVCYGDSITYGYPCYTRDRVSQVGLPYPELLQSQLRFHFENSNITIKNEGNIGWQSYQAYKNVGEKVIAEQPDLCIMMFGINDCKGSFQGGFPLSKRNYKKYLNRCINILHSNNIDILLLTPTPAYIPRLSKFASIAIEVASAHNLHCVDMYHDILNLIQDRNEKYRDVFLDGVHFRDDAYRYISDTLLEAFIKFS